MKLEKKKNLFDKSIYSLLSIEFLILNINIIIDLLNNFLKVLKLLKKF